MASFNPKKSIERAGLFQQGKTNWSLKVAGRPEYKWKDKLERVALLREGIPYSALEVLSQKANLPTKHFLHLINMPQTTYNKKKKEQQLMGKRDSEVVLLMAEVLHYGLDVFNGEKEKFQSWLRKPAVSLGGVAPESLFDSFTGIQEIKNSLNRLEYGNLA